MRRMSSIVADDRYSRINLIKKNRTNKEGLLFENRQGSYVAVFTKVNWECEGMMVFGEI